jgi:hypothetical protein
MLPELKGYYTSASFLNIFISRTKNINIFANIDVIVVSWLGFKEKTRGYKLPLKTKRTFRTAFGTKPLKEKSFTSVN